ncbi:MAG: phosphotransferase, partial [Polyangiaceae bacterium]
PQAKEDIYRKAVLDLAKAQVALDPARHCAEGGREALPRESIVRARAFDFDLLKWEVDHFLEWGLEARGIFLDPQDRLVFDRAATHLAKTIASWPQSFVHRDYQSRNLMVRGPSGQEELVWIDFQDALLGPRVYDLVALLNDSYQTFTREFVEARLEEFGLALGLGERERAQVVWEFDFVTVQRKLKDAGRFVFIDRVRGNPDYLGFVEPTIEKAFASMERCKGDPVVAELQTMLGRILQA